MPASVEARLRRLERQVADRRRAIEAAARVAAAEASAESARAKLAELLAEARRRGTLQELSPEETARRVRGLLDAPRARAKGPTLPGGWAGSVDEEGRGSEPPARRDGARSCYAV